MSSLSSFIKTQRFQDSRLSVYVSGRPFGVPLMIHAVVLQNAINKVAWYVLRVKIMHFWSPTDPLGPRGEVKPS